MKTALCAGGFVCLLLFMTLPARALRLPADTLPEAPVTWQDWPLRRLDQFSISEMQKISGQHLTLRERASLQLLRWQWKRELRRHPDLTVGEYLARKPMSPVVIVLLILLFLSVMCFLVLFRDYLSLQPPKGPESRETICSKGYDRQSGLT